jgi:hypothetical protein
MIKHLRLIVISFILWSMFKFSAFLFRLEESWFGWWLVSGIEDERLRRGFWGCCFVSIINFNEVRWKLEFLQFFFLVQLEGLNRKCHPHQREVSKLESECVCGSAGRERIDIYKHPRKFVIKFKPRMLLQLRK